MDARFDDTANLDERLDAFEDSWQHALTPPELKEFLPSRTSPLWGRAMVELVMIDLERRLRRERQTNAKNTTGQIELSWLIGRYLRDFPELTQTSGWLAELVCFDAQLRQSLGNPTELDGYFSRLSVFAHLFEQDLRRTFAEMAAATLLWFLNGHLLWRGLLPALLELGRAEKGDPPVPCQVATPKGVRLVVASEDDSAVSRRQLVVEVIGPRRIPTHVAAMQAAGNMAVALSVRYANDQNVSVSSGVRSYSKRVGNGPLAVHVTLYAAWATATWHNPFHQGSPPSNDYVRWSRWGYRGGEFVLQGGQWVEYQH